MVGAEQHFLLCQLLQVVATRLAARGQASDPFGYVEA
jgi:hypothetical protein